MIFKDQWAQNSKGERFVFTVEMQRNLQKANLPIEPDSLAQLPDISDTDYAQPAVQRTEKQHEYEGDPPQDNASADDAVDFEAPATIQIDPMTGKYIGRMKWFNNKKGYGFIVRGGGEEIFFHKSGTTNDPGTLNEGQWVLYDVEETRKGPEAMEVEPYEGDTEELMG